MMFEQKSNISQSMAETDDSKMTERIEVLGFKPQKEIPYNKLLPYNERLDVESNEQLALIKTNLARTVQLRDIKFGASHWTGQLAKYIRIHGHKYSKEDHLAFIKLLFELTIIPDLTYSLVQKFAQLLITLLKKRQLITRDDLELPWQPLYKLVQNAVYSPYDYHGLILFPANIETVLKQLVRACRLYFPLEATQEMLEEWRPLLCPFDMTMLKGMYFLELFLPTTLPPEQHDKGFKLWFDEFMNLYQSCQNCPSWEGNLVHLFSRLASDTIGYIQWDLYIDQIFTRILRSFSLPVGNGEVHIGSANNCYEVSSICWWISSMLGGGSTCQQHLTKMFKALESFYHPSNVGKWNNKLLKLMSKLPQAVTKRFHRERYKKTWLPEIPESNKLKNEEITEFVNSIKNIVFLAMFNKLGSHDSAACFQHLAVLRPEIIIPPLLEKTYPALETLTEPHRLIACLQCLVAVARQLLGNHKWFPGGRSHVIPLLNHCLPGIDPNDIKKCLTTFQLISTIVSLVPLVDCSEAVHIRDDLTEDERELCFASAQMEDIAMQFVDRVICLIENSSNEQTRTDNTAADRLSHEETMIEVGLLSTINAIVQQSSDKIFDQILKRIFRFATTNVYEVKVAGRFTADIVRAVTKVNPDKALKKFVMHFCDVIKHRTSSEDFVDEEHLDNEFLWNLNLLSECVRCDGKVLLPYLPELKVVLKVTLHLKCKEAANLAGNLLRHVLRALSTTYPLDYRSIQPDWNQPLSEFLPIREWGKAGDVNSLEMTWHVASKEEQKMVQSLLEDFMLPELDAIDAHSKGSKTMDREVLQNSLRILLHCVMGSGVLLQPLEGENYPLVESLVDLTRFDIVASPDDEICRLRSANVRMLVMRSMRPLVDHMLSNAEDDTKSFNIIIKIYQCLLFFQGAQKEDFDARWKSLHLVKKAMENKLQGKKMHIRALLVDRVQLQHELRVINHSAKNFTVSHKELMDDLFRLSTSRYIVVRQTAQSVLNHGFYLYAYSYKCKVDDVVQYLKDDPEVEEYHFKGALYVLFGTNKRSLMTKRNWETMLKVWPTLIQAKHTEKPSILKLIDDIADKMHKNIETNELSIEVHDALLDVALSMWSTGSQPQPTLPPATADELSHGLEQQTLRNNGYLQCYHKLTDELVRILGSGELRWKFQLMGLEMLGLLLRQDVTFPEHAVSLFVKNIINENIQIRKLSTMATSAALKVQKRKHPMVELNPYEISKTERPAPGSQVQPGDRPDNMWHHYRSVLPWKQEDWDSITFVEKTHWGYSCWPRVMKVYSKNQPSVDRTLEDLAPEERPIYEHFSDAAFIDQLIKYLSLEGTKGKDHFHSKFFVLFKGVFRNFGDAFLVHLRPHVERMVADTSPETHESNHRCAAEIVAGLIRGCKHWPLDKMKSMWEWLEPVLKTVLSNVSVESVKDWGTCFATSSESRDPKQIAPLLELLLENPLRGEGGSFGDSSRLYMLQGALAQQEWRVPSLLHSFVEYARPHLSHPYKNVRDRLGSVLVNMFLYDITIAHGVPTTSPHKTDFLNMVLPQLEILTKSEPPTTQNGTEKQSTDRPEPMDTREAPALSTSDIRLSTLHSLPTEGASNGENGESDERKTAIRLFKTVMKWLQGHFSRTFQCASPEVFQFLPLVCQLRSEVTDEELKHDCILSSAFLAKALLSHDLVPVALETVEKVASMSQWHARGSIMSYLQVMVFNNLFLVQDAATRAQIRDIVLHRLCDDQLEVRELAAITLGGFLHCGYMTMDEEMMTHFEKLSSTKIKKKTRLESIKPELLIRRHAGVLGLSACIQAYPYDVPEFIPQLLMDLSDHLDDPQPIQMTVKKTLSNFKRTHHDNWQDHKQKFTDDQLVVLTELLVSPNYYA